MPKDPPGRRALVVVPTYNERDNVDIVVSRLFEAVGDCAHLLVVDDGSPDGTAEQVKHIAAERDDVFLIERAGKLGLGTAYIEGFTWGLQRGYWAMVEMDADLSHDPADVPRLLDALEHTDLVVGYRYVPGGAVENWGLVRRLLSRGANLYVRWWLRLGVRDATAGFRAYRAQIVPLLELESVHFEGYGFQIELTRRLVRRGGRVAEIPITFSERAVGVSKMSPKIVLEALWHVTLSGVLDTAQVMRKR
jgi:dolichol-phosphate mannosyltransferase